MRETLEKSSKILTDVKIGVEHMAHKLQHLKAVRSDEVHCVRRVQFMIGCGII